MSGQCLHFSSKWLTVYFGTVLSVSVSLSAEHSVLRGRRLLAVSTTEVALGAVELPGAQVPCLHLSSGTCLQNSEESAPGMKLCL